MRLTDKRLKEIISVVIGEEVLPIVGKLKGKENVAELKVADDLNIDIKRVRSALYKLYNHDLVKFTRKKDKIKGWYVYFWTLKPNNIKYLYMKNKKEIYAKILKKIEKEENNQFFSCDNNCVRLDFDSAVNFEFNCPECGEVVNKEENESMIKALKKEARELKKEIKKENYV